MTVDHNKQSSRSFRYREWDIYIDARKLRLSIEDVIKGLPSVERFALIDQLRRAALSVILNIAEGANRTSDKDRKLYISRALGSVDEVVACIDCANDSNYLSKDDVNKFLDSAESLAKRLNGFAKHLDVAQAKSSSKINS